MLVSPPRPRLFFGTALSWEAWASVMQCVCCGWAQQFGRVQKEWAIRNGKGAIKGGFPEEVSCSLRIQFIGIEATEME